MTEKQIWFREQYEYHLNKALIFSERIDWGNSINTYSTAGSDKYVESNKDLPEDFNPPKQ